MKRVFKLTGAVIGIIFILLIIASVAVMIIVDREFIEKQMKSALNRHITIENISVGVFSVVSGIEVDQVKISNYKTAEELKALEGKPVPAKDLFVGLRAFKFRLEFLPLLGRRFVLRELTLYGPRINVVRGTNGAFNFDDLLAAKPMTEEEKARAEKKRKEEKAGAAKKTDGPSDPLTADNIPVRVTIGKIGIEKGILTFTDLKSKQSFQAYNITVLVHSIDIDPEELSEKNSVKLSLALGIKSVGRVKSGSVKSFDAAFSTEGFIKPFDLKTRMLDPEVTVKAGSTRGTMTGLQIFEKMKDTESLSKYCGKLSFLKKDVTWKNAFVNVWYKSGTVKMNDGTMTTDDYKLSFGGKANVNSGAAEMQMDMILAEKHQKSIRSGLEKNVKKALKAAGVSKYISSEKITEKAMKPLLNDEGRVYLNYEVTGTMSSPRTRLIHPKLPSLKNIIKDAAGDVKDVAKDRAKARAKTEAKKRGDRVLKKIKKKKLF